MQISNTRNEILSKFKRPLRQFYTKHKELSENFRLWCS